MGTVTMPSGDWLPRQAPSVPCHAVTGLGCNAVRVRSLRKCALMALLGLLMLAPAAMADWINLTGAETAPNIAEIYVLDDHVKVVLEIYVGNLEVFADLLPDSLLRDASGRASLEERLQRFSRETFQVVTSTGERLDAVLRLAEPRLRTDRRSPFAGMINPSTRQRVPEAPADKRVLYVELVYRLNTTVRMWRSK